MGIPLLAPSLRLLTQWHMQFGMVSERTWDTVLAGAPARGSVLPRHPAADEPFDPNDEYSEDAVTWWLQWSDWYVFPHVLLFDSWEDAAEKIASADLGAVSAAMRDFSAQQVRARAAAAAAAAPRFFFFLCPRAPLLLTAPRRSTQERNVTEQWAALLRGLPSREERAASDARLAGLSYEARMDALYGAGQWAEY